MLFHSKFYYENQMWLIKRYARKSIYHGCMVWIEKLSLEITVRHHSASLVMPISDPRDRFFYPHHTPMKDTYILDLCDERRDLTKKRYVGEGAKEGKQTGGFRRQ